MTWHDMTWHDMILDDMIWYDIAWYDMIWFGIWYPTTGHDCLGKLLSRSGRSGVLLFSLLRKRFLCSVFPCAPYLSWEACSVQTYLVRMCCKNIQQEHALHTFCQVFLKQCRAWPWSQSNWHRVDSVWHCKIWISIMRITDVSCRKALTRFRSYKASQSSHASQTLQALQGDYVVTTFQFGVSQLLVLINAMEHSNSWQSVFPPDVALRIHMRFSTGIFWCCVFCLLPPKMLRWSRKQVSKSVFRISKLPTPCRHSSLGRSGRSVAYPCTGLQMFAVLWGLCISPK